MRSLPKLHYRFGKRIQTAGQGCFGKLRMMFSRYAYYAHNHPPIPPVSPWGWLSGALLAFLPPRNQVKLR